MPCYDPYSKDDSNDSIKNELKVHRLTAMLCGLCGRVEATMPELISTDSKLSEWWKDHKKHDQMIAALKEKRKTPGVQLTSEEYKMLWDHSNISY